MDDSDNSYDPSQSPSSPGSPTLPQKTKSVVTAPTTSAPTTRTTNMSSTRPKQSSPASSADSSEDDRSYDFPVPRPQTIPSADQVVDDPTLRSLWNFHDLHNSLNNNLDNVLQESPLTQDHFNESSVLHTLFFIKKVATIQCDSCEGKGRGDETYKCAQCVKQICRQCMEHMLDREAAAPDHEKEAAKWNWQGQYRHEGLKRCYIDRKANRSNDSHHIDIPVSLLGVDSSDTVTIHMVKGNNVDDTAPKINKDPRQEREVIDLTDDLPEPTTTKKTRSAPKNSSRKSAVSSAQPRSGVQRDATTQRTRLGFSSNVSRTPDQIETAAVNQRGRLSSSPEEDTRDQTATMSSNNRRQGLGHQSQQRSHRRRPQQHGQPHIPPFTQPAVPQYTQPATYNQTYHLHQGQLAAQATPYQTLPAAQRPGNSYQQFGNQAAYGPGHRAIFAPPPGSFLLVPNPNNPSGFETVSWDRYQDYMNRSQQAASSGLSNAAQPQPSTTSGSAAQTAQVPRQLSEDDPHDPFPRDGTAGAALGGSVYPISTIPAGGRGVVLMPSANPAGQSLIPTAFSRGAGAALVQLSPPGSNHFRYRDGFVDDYDQPMPDAGTPTRAPNPPPASAPRRESPRLETINDILRALSPSPPPAAPSAPAAMPSGPISGGRQGQRGEDGGRLEEVQAQARVRAALALVPEAQEEGLRGGEGEEEGEEGGEEDGGIE